MPKATAADCKSIREHEKAISQNVPVEQFGLKYKEEKRFDDPACVGVGLTATTRQCLMGAPDLKAFSGCAIVPSAAVAVAASKVEGQWTLQDTDNPDDANVVGAKLEVGPVKAAFSMLGVPVEDDLNLASENGDEFTFVFPLPGHGKNPTVTGKINGEHLIVVLPAHRRETLTFKHATYDSFLAKATK